MATTPIAPRPTTVTVKPASTVPAFHIHIAYIVCFLIVAGLTWYGGHVLWQEHETRVQAEATIKIQEANVKNLQQQIATNDATTAATIASLQKTIAGVKTPAQVIQVLPQVLPAPLPVPPVLNPDNSVTLPSQDVMALFQDLSQCKIQAVSLAGTQKDLATQTQIIADQKIEIAALKKKPAFWARVKRDSKILATGVGIGAFLVLLH